MNTVLSIAGSDCSGGAGIQADLKTIGAFGVYGMSVITAITVQNTCGVYRVQPVDAGIVSEQLHAVWEDIPPDAVKIGMVATAENVTAIASVLGKHPAPLVLDPVMLSTSGKELLNNQAAEALMEKLFPLAAVLTPNLPESEYLWGSPIASRRDRERAAEQLSKRYGCSVLIKGGHGDAADDFLFVSETGTRHWYCKEKIENPNTHGTGCTLSSAIACGLAEGLTLPESVQAAKDYITGAIRDGMDLGRGNGPLNHFWNMSVGGRAVPSYKKEDYHGFQYKK